VVLAGIKIVVNLLRTIAPPLVGNGVNKWIRIVLLQSKEVVEMKAVKIFAPLS
jgi:hypothetical protein